MLGKWKAILPAVLIVLLTLLLFRSYVTKKLVPFPANLLVSYYEPWQSYPAPEYPNGPPNKAMGFDNLRIYYPLKKVAIDAFRHGEVPLWNPYEASGTLLLATYQSAVFHPLGWLFLVMPQIDAWSLIVILEPVIAFAAMYLLLSTFTLTLPAKIIGSLAYATSGFFMVWWEESYLFIYSSISLPIALALVERYIQKPTYRILGFLSLALAVSLYSGAFQMSFYVYVFLFIYLLYRLWTHPQKVRIGSAVVGSMVLALFLGGIQLIPNIETYAQSARATADIKYIFSSQLLPLSQLVTFLAPDYFGNPATYNYFGKGFYHERLFWLGAVPFLFLLTQVFKKRISIPHGKFFQWAFWATLSLSLALPTSWLILYYLRLPLLSTMTPSRIIMLVAFLGSILAAYGMEEQQVGFSRSRLFWITGFISAGFIAAGSAPFLAKHWDPKNTSYVLSLRNLVIPGMSFFAAVAIVWTMFVKPAWKKIGMALLIALTMANSVLFGQKYLYFSERRFVYPEVPVLTELKKRAGFTRFWTYDNGYIEKNFASYFGLFSPEGYDSIMIRRYAEFLSYANSRGKSMEPDRANALIQSTDHLNDILLDPYRKKTLQLLGVRYILQKLVPDRNEQKLLPDPKELPRIWADSAYAIHEYPDSLPRAMLYRDIRVVPDGKHLLTALFDQKTDIKKTVFVERPVDLSESIVPLIGTARITAYTANSVTASYVSTAPSFLLLSDVWAPGWIAFVDGRETPLLRADYAFRGVVAPAGIHTVRMEYRPRTWTLGLVVSTVGAIITAALILWPYRPRPKPRLEK